MASSGFNPLDRASERFGAGETGPAPLQGAVLPGIAHASHGRAGALLSLSSAPNVLGLLLALRRRWLLAVMLGLVGAAVVGTAVWAVMPTTYTARSVLQVMANRPTILFQTPDDRQDFSNYQRSQVALIKSRVVLNRALGDPKVAGVHVLWEKGDPLDTLEKEIQTDYSIAPEYLRVSLSGKDPSELVAVVNAVCNAYLKEVTAKEHSARLARLDKLKQLATEYEDQLRSKKRMQREMANEVGGKNQEVLTVKHTLALGLLNSLQTELLATQSQLRKERLELAAQEGRKDGKTEAVVPENLLEQEAAKDKLVQRYLGEIQKYDNSIADARQFLQQPALEKSAKYKSDMKTLEATKVMLANRRTEIRSNLLKELQAKGLDNQKLTREQRQATINYLQEVEKTLTQEVDKRAKELQELSKSTVELDYMKDEIAQAEELAKKFSAQAAALNVEIGAPARVTLWDEASFSRTQDEKRPLKMGGMAAAGVFGLVLLGVSLWEFRSRKVNSVDEVVQGLGMKLVGTLPILPERAHRSHRGASARDAHWHNQLIESVDATRTMLLHRARQEALRCVMVTSALGGEGKTMLSSHLAASLARAGCKTLLVDCDLRSPSIHHLFDMVLEPGVCEVLRSDASLAEAIRPGPIHDLWVLPSGQCDQRALRALAQGDAGELFQLVKEQYDFVIVDSAPVLPVADSLLIGQHADAVILSVLRDVSRLPSIHAAYERLATLGIHMLGAVVNGVNTGLYGSSYQYTAPPAAKV